VGHDKHIKALDGLRFIAAASVMLAHGVSYILMLQRDEAMTPPLMFFLHLSNFGMTLFFVLSGFVIHVNYRDQLPKPGGPKNFFLARWSRLYPLFFMVFAVQIANTVMTQGVTADLLRPMPFYLTFTESWWFWPVYNVHSQAAYTGVPGVMWSLSTEAFFYLSYVFIAPAIGRLSVRATLLAIAVTGAATYLVCTTIIYHSGEITAWATANVDAESSAHFVQWLGYYSPWIRIFEFLMGAFAAQMYMAGYRPRRSDLLAGVCLAIIAALYLSCLYLGVPLGMSDTTICAAFFAGLCLAGTSLQGRFARFMGARAMVLGGEASYSLYLLHYWVLHTVTQPRVMSFGWYARLFWLIVAMAAAICLSRLVYVFFERPAMRFFRAGRIVLPAIGRKARAISEAKSVGAPPESVQTGKVPV